MLLSNINYAQPQKDKARARFVVDVGAIHPTSLNAGIDNNYSNLVGLSIEKPFRVAKAFYFTTGIGLQEQKYFIDGYFYKSGTVTTFKPVEAATINNNLTLTEFKIPVLFSFPLFSKNNNCIALNAGADINIFLSATRRYKQYGGSKIAERFSIENKLLFPLRVEVSTLNLSKGRTLSDLLFFGFGVRQQITPYLKNIQSFKPFEGYLRIGIHF